VALPCAALAPCAVLRLRSAADAFCAVLLSAFSALCFDYAQQPAAFSFALCSDDFCAILYFQIGINQ
jgi:hypothetical protein